MSKCAICRAEYERKYMSQPTCGESICKTELRRQKERQKADREEIRLRKEKIKSRRDWLDEAQAAVNSYIRARDVLNGCVSCDRSSTWNGQWHASHFRSVGAASSVRFNLWNIHKSCSICNNFKSGNLGEYAPRLRAKIGDEKVDWLYSQNAPVTYSIEYLQRLKKVFTKKTKRLLERNRNGLQES